MGETVSCLHLPFDAFSSFQFSVVFSFGRSNCAPSCIMVGLYLCFAFVVQSPFRYTVTIHWCPSSPCPLPFLYGLIDMHIIWNNINIITITFIVRFCFHLIIMCRRAMSLSLNTSNHLRRNIMAGFRNAKIVQMSILQLHNRKTGYFFDALNKFSFWCMSFTPIMFLMSTITFQTQRLSILYFIPHDIPLYSV